MDGKVIFYRKICVYLRLFIYSHLFTLKDDEDVQDEDAEYLEYLAREVNHFTSFVLYFY